MAENEEKIEYPEAHPRHAEIKEIKDYIDSSFKSYKELMEKARFNYKIADDALKEMGSSLKKAQKILEEVAPKMNELSDIITAPLI